MKGRKISLGKIKGETQSSIYFIDRNGLLGTFIRGLKWLNLVKSCFSLFFFCNNENDLDSFRESAAKGFSLTFWLFILNGNSSWSSHADFNGGSRIPKTFMCWLMKVFFAFTLFSKYIIAPSINRYNTSDIMIDITAIITWFFIFYILISFFHFYNLVL